jgi:hypothetical protein
LKPSVYNEPAFTGGANLTGAITGLTDEAGQRLGSYSYDSTGRATGSKWWAGANQTQPVNNTALLYSGPGVTPTVTDALGSQRTYN